VYEKMIGGEYKMFGRKTKSVPEELPELPGDMAYIEERKGNAPLPAQQVKVQPVQQEVPKQRYVEEPREEVAPKQPQVTEEVKDAIEALKRATIVGAEGLTPGESLICNLLFAILIEARRP
jgi:hypothetical protein